MAASDSDSEISITQTPNTDTALASQEIISPKKTIWGRLLTTVLHLPPVDLDKPHCLVGRAINCDVMLTKKNFTSNCLTTISKNHFLIFRKPEESVFITDLSKNGTFINGVCIGRNKTVILQNDDTIGIGAAKGGEVDNGKGMQHVFGKKPPIVMNKRQNASYTTIYVYKSMEIGRNPYLPPELSSKYEVSKFLGTGAFGEVRLVFEKTTCQQYAVKKIRKAKMINRNEINILSSLSHPHIIKTKESAETEEAVFVILEYMERGELDDFLRESGSPLSESEIKFIFYQIAVGLQYLHSKNITHRDLKPGNILVKSDKSGPIVKISDFGLSKIIDSNTFMKTLCGTPQFVAPEIVDYQCKRYNQKVDVWSLGVLLFYMFTNDLPFKSEVKSLNPLFQIIMSAKYEMDEEVWASVSNDAIDLVKKMLTRYPEDRITVDDILKHPWIAEDKELQMKAECLRNQVEDFSDITNNLEMQSIADMFPNPQEENTKNLRRVNEEQDSIRQRAKRPRLDNDNNNI